MCPTARDTQTGVEHLIRQPLSRRVVNHKRTEMEQGRKGLENACLRDSSSAARES